MINKLINRKNLARKSATPGKTQTLNYYRINSELYFVDFPGYGYAKVSKSLREKFGKMIERYLSEREILKLGILVVDLRHPPSKEDQAMYDWLVHYEIPRCVVTTKADKIPKGKWAKHRKIVKDTLHMVANDPMICFSSELGLGKEELWGVIEAHINTPNH